MEKIVRYLQEKYAPRALLVYGSFVRGDQDEFSDFDCMIIVDTKTKNHDDSIIDGVQLDCFIFTAAEVAGDDIDTFLTAFDSTIVFDDGIGAELKKRVREYVSEHTVIEKSEKEFIASWIQKTIRRMYKNDDEGNYRAVVFLFESLTDYCFLRDIFYFGSKKTIALLKENDPRGYDLFHAAITLKTNDSIEAWGKHIISTLGQ
ncbi:MAG: nucleotidyltransferase domain-containing protein [Clostridia bacterium]|nr:nucleotidyltransferase domain-containing protein [Clostridia bacterium]